jgi:hypothetical protein
MPRDLRKLAGVLRIGGHDESLIHRRTAASHWWMSLGARLSRRER